MNMISLLFFSKKNDAARALCAQSIKKGNRIVKKITLKTAGTPRIPTYFNKSAKVSNPVENKLQKIEWSTKQKKALLSKTTAQKKIGVIQKKKLQPYEKGLFYIPSHKNERNSPFLIEGRKITHMPGLHLR